MLEDSSFAIQPGIEKEKQAFYDIGNVLEVKIIDEIVYLKCENGHVNILFYRNDIVRIIYNPISPVSLKSSPAIIQTPKQVSFIVEDLEEQVVIQLSSLIIKIKKTPLRIGIFTSQDQLLLNEGAKGMAYTSNKQVICYKEMEIQDYFFGFGEKTGYLNKRGEKLVMWNSDVYAPHNPETNSLYQSIPFFITLRSGKAHGVFFDNTFKSIFNYQSSEYEYSFSAEGGQLDYYFMAGSTPKEVLEQYTYLTGRSPIPAKWTLGYHQSRYSYQSELEIRQLIKTFIEKKIPIDAVFLDIHYMDGYRVFTFNQDRFPNPGKLVLDLKKMGIKVVPIVDPGVKADPEYVVYQEGIHQNSFCKYIEGTLFFGDVWPGKSVFPDFTNMDVRKWWGEKHQVFVNLGIEGIWNDMNEPAVFNETKTMDIKVMHDNDGDPRTHREIHNLYGLLMGMSTYESLKNHLNGNRPFLLTRAGYAGIQRYAAVWTGDNRSFWEHLQMSIPMILNLGLSGIAFAGADVGGFAHDCNGELLVRWMQVGVFMPYFRNHSALDCVRQEPWAFGEYYEKIIKKYIKLRYQWLPHFYTLFAETFETGVPIMRPLFLEYPDDERTYQLNDQFMVGANVIIAPILQPGSSYRVVYLPKGKWVDYWTGLLLEGNQYHMIKANLDTIPIFVKNGSVIIHGEVKASTSVADEKLILHYYYDETATEFILYEDDGVTFDYTHGCSLKKIFNINSNDQKIDITLKHIGNYIPDWKRLELMVHGACADVLVRLNGKEIPTENNIYVLEDR